MNSHNREKPAISIARLTSQFGSFLAQRLWVVFLSLLLLGVLVLCNFLLLDKVLLYKDVGADSINDTYPYFGYL
jgi:hypothetical protein